MKDKVRVAYLATRQGFSADRVVVDPDLNSNFLKACRSHDLTESAREINRCLLNLRKAGLMKGLPSSRKTSFANEDDYRHASEVSVRFLERRDSVSLDDIICDPDLAEEYDRICESIAPGFSSLQYRWAALNLRKARRLKPELLSRVIKPTSTQFGQVQEINASQTIPNSQGLYIFYSPTETLYVGEACNLLRRLEKHLDHSDNKGLARWLWDNGDGDLHLEIQTLPDDTNTRIRRALEKELIQSRRPKFNVLT